MKDKINDILLQMQNNRIDVGEASNQLFNLCIVSLPHESQIDEALDKLMIIRGEHPSRVRNPLYGEERQLAKDLVKYVLLLNNKQ